jgi:hypothetical protein
LVRVVMAFHEAKHGQRSEEGGEHDQPDRDAVHAHVVVDVGAGDPGIVDFKLKAGLPGNEVRGQMQRKAERREHDQQREPLDHLSRRGNSATTTAPAAGSRVMAVNIQAFRQGLRFPSLLLRVSFHYT